TTWGGWVPSCYLMQAETRTRDTMPLIDGMDLYGACAEVAQAPTPEVARSRLNRNLRRAARLYNRTHVRVAFDELFLAAERIERWAACKMCEANWPLAAASSEMRTPFWRFAARYYDLDLATSTSPRSDLRLDAIARIER